MRTSTQTAAELADAQTRLERAEQALGQLQHDLARGDRATIAAAREREDDVRGECNEATFAFEIIDAEHAATVKRERETQARVALDAHAATRGLVAKHFSALDKLAAKLAEEHAAILALLASDAAQCQQIERLSAELGEPVAARPMTLAQSLAVRLSVAPPLDPTAAAWLSYVADPSDRAREILRLLGGTGAPPAGMTVTDAAQIALAALDASEAERVAGQRSEATWGPIREYEARVTRVRTQLHERCARAGYPLTGAESARFDRSSDPPEERARQIIETRAEQAERYGHALGAA
jgi:hypothetical protein